MMLIKIIYNRLIPFKGYSAMTLLFWVFVRKEYEGRLSEKTINHEKIHACQQSEIWALAILIGLGACLLTPLSWWWMLATPAIPLLLYVLSWLVEVALPPYDKAYYNTCFETEAYYNENDMDYLKKRKWFTFKFLKYVSNKKYDYKGIR